MNRYKTVISAFIACAFIFTACDTEESVLVPTGATVTTTITETEVAETTISPSVTATATPSPRISGTTNAVSETVETTEENTEETEDSEPDENNTSSGYVSTGSTETPAQTSAPSGSTYTTPSATTSAPRSTPVPKPTEDTRYMKYLSCGDCGNKTLVYTPGYRYTTPEKSHVETNPTWDYGIKHCEVQINWMHSAWYTDEEYYNGHFDERPDIREPFEFKVDMDGNPIEDWNAIQREAIARALTRAHAWTESIGIYESRCSWQTNVFYDELEKINYQENPYTVIDEPEHEYECTAYICDTCGAVVVDWRDVKQIR